MFFTFLNTLYMYYIYIYIYIYNIYLILYIYYYIYYIYSIFYIICIIYIFIQKQGCQGYQRNGGFDISSSYYKLLQVYYKYVFKICKSDIF